MDHRIELIQGDITRQHVDAIVNAANTSLLGGGGVDGAIHRAGGPEILEDCYKVRARQGGCQVGEAVITTAGNLPARHVIHTVGPVWQGFAEDGNTVERDLLASTYRNSLKLAAAHDLKSIAFPNISTGIYRFPKSLACKVALQETEHFLQDNLSFDKVIFVCFDDENYRLYKGALEG